MKKAFYTINFGGYDSIKEPYVTPGWDYFLFTDRDYKSNIYKIINIAGLPPHLQARDCYINSQKYFPEYDLTFMVGGQIELKGNLDEFILTHCDLSYDFNMFKHPCRTCIYQEAEVIIREKIDAADKVNRQMDKYRGEGMPANYGLNAHGVIIRKRSENVKRHEELWWQEVITHSHRDQLSFMYILWKYNLVTVKTFPYDLIRSRWFQVYQHKTNKPI